MKPEERTQTLESLQNKNLTTEESLSLVARDSTILKYEEFWQISLSEDNWICLIEW